jgi:hypothetical protein
MPADVREIGYADLVGDLRGLVGRRVHVQMRSAVAGDFLSVYGELDPPKGIASGPRVAQRA